MTTLRIKADKTLKMVFLFSIFVGIVFSENIVIDMKKEGVIYTAESLRGSKKETFTVRLSTSEGTVHLSEYVNITFMPLDQITKFQMPIMTFSSKDPKVETREQVAQSPLVPLEMYIKREQIDESGLKEFYFAVEWPEEKNVKVSYYVTIGTSYIPILFPKTSHSQFTYYVGKGAESFKFAINHYDSQPNSVITVYVRGTKIKDTYLKCLNDYNKIPSKNFGYGYAYTFNQRSVCPRGHYDIEISSEEGDYISIETKTLDDDFSNLNELVPNYPQTYGYLVKDVHPREYFKLVLDKLGKELGQGLLYINYHTPYIKIYYADKNKKKIDGSEQILKSSNVYPLLINNNTLVQQGAIYFVVEIPEEHSAITDIPFSLQFTTEIIPSYLHNLFGPQIGGSFYHRVLKKGEIGVYYGMGALKDKEIKYSMIAETGNAKMYFAHCTNFPFCVYNKDNIKQKANEVKNVNRMFMISDSTTTSSTNPVSRNQNVIIVHCDSEEKSCLFKTGIFSDREKISLKREEPFYQYKLKDQKDNYIVKLYNENLIRRLRLDFMVLTGDIKIEFSKNQQIKNAKYFSHANKYFYSIEFNPVSSYDNVEFTVTALNNSFYTAHYHINYEESRDIEYIQESGINYLQSIPNLPYPFPRSKVVKVKNLNNFDDDGLFLVNFHSMNCKFNVQRDNIEIPVTNYYAQDLMDSKNQSYSNNTYDYTISVSYEDINLQEFEPCLIYMSGVNLKAGALAKNTQIKQIVISEGIPQRIQFKGFNEIIYVYTHASYIEKMLIKFKLYGRAQYDVTLNVECDTNKKNIFKISRDQSIIYSPEADVICMGTTGRYISKITVKLSQVVDEDPMLDVTVSGYNDKIPIYLKKTQLMQEVFLDRFQFYYTDIGKNEMGSVEINYRRGSGKIFGKIVKKDLAQPEEGANWKGLYKLPVDAESGDLIYTPYLKKLNYGPEETEVCENGCYLIIGIQPSVVNKESYGENYYPGSLLLHSSPSERSYQDIPVVNIPEDEFILGNLAKATSNNIYEFYRITFTRDSSEVLIDWQSKLGNLYIRIGEEKPRTNKYDFEFYGEGQDTLITLSKERIISTIKKQSYKVPHEDSLKDLTLTLGISTNSADSIDTTLYNFKISLAEDKVSPIKVYGDQKTSCKLKQEKDGKYRCLFVIMHEYRDIESNLIVYPVHSNPSAYLSSYANHVDSTDIETHVIDKIKDKIPSKTKSEFNSREIGYDYLFLPASKYNQGRHLLVVIEANKEGTIDLLTSYYTFTETITPNPRTPQLFYLKGKNLYFDFKSSKDVLIHMISVKGEAEIYWENDDDLQYFLRGRNDRIAFTSFTSEEEKMYNRLVVKNLNPTTEENDPGFVFYIYYEARPVAQNFDPLEFGQTVEVSYRDTDFPLEYYLKLPSTNPFDNDINVVFTFNELIGNALDPKPEYDFQRPLLIAFGEVISGQLVNQKQQNPYIKPESRNRKFGVLDPTVRTITISFTKTELKGYGIKDSQNPYLYIAIRKPEYNVETYTKISLDATVFASNMNNFTPEKLYNFGKLNTGVRFNKYKLRTDKVKKSMLILFSSKSEYIQYSIQTREVNARDMRKNSTEIKLSNKMNNMSGRKIVEIEDVSGFDQLYLYVFIIDEYETVTLEDKLKNYVFKYVNSVQSADVKVYYLPNAKLNYKFDKDSCTISFDKKIGLLVPTEFTKVYYNIKLVTDADYVEGESLQNIAMGERFTHIHQFVNPESEGIEYTFRISQSRRRVRYVSVVVEIQDKTIREFLAYKAILFDNKDMEPTDESKEKKGKDNKEEEESDDHSNALFIIVFIIAVALLIGVVVLIVIIFKNRTKNQNLLEQVIKTSFQVENKEPVNDAQKDLLGSGNALA